MWKLLRDLVVGCLPLRQARLSEPERDTNVNKSHRHTATRRPTEGDIIAQVKRSCPGPIAIVRTAETASTGTGKGSRPSSPCSSPPLSGTDWSDGGCDGRADGRQPPNYHLIGGKLKNDARSKRQGNNYFCAQSPSTTVNTPTGPERKKHTHTHTHMPAGNFVANGEEGHLANVEDETPTCAKGRDRESYPSGPSFYKGHLTPVFPLVPHWPSWRRPRAVL